MGNRSRGFSASSIVDTRGVRPARALAALSPIAIIIIKGLIRAPYLRQPSGQAAAFPSA